MKKFRGSAVVAGLSVLALTLAGCAATEELTPTSSPAAVTEEATLAPLITVGWNHVREDFRGWLQSVEINVLHPLQLGPSITWIDQSVGPAIIIPDHEPQDT